MKKRLSPFILLCLMGGLAIWSSTMAKNPALPLFIRSLGVPVSTVGFIAAASTVVGIVVSIPAGILSDIIGRRKVILTAAVIFASAPFLYLLVHAPWQLVLVRVYHGLATAILGPVAMAAVSDTYSERRGERMGWYSSATMVGRFIAPFAGGLLIFGNNFQWVYLADGVIGVLALIAAVTLPLSRATSSSAGKSFGMERHEVWQEIRFILQQKAILATSGIEAVQYFAYGCIETFLPIFLREQAGLSTSQIGILFTVQTLCATLIKPMMGRLSDRYGRVRMITIGLVSGGFTVALMTRAGNYFLLLGLMGLFGLGLSTVTSSTSAFVVDLSRASSRGSSLGILSGIMDVGHSAGPMVSGLLIGAYSYNFTFGVVGISLAAIGLLYGLIMRHVGQPASP